MADSTHLAGKVVALWRYPIKSMQGEQVPVGLLAQGSLLGDRAFALLDQATGLVASAKHPDRWSRLLACQAAFVEPPTEGVALPPVRVTLPDGTSLLSERPDFNRRLSQALGRAVVLSRTTLASPRLEQYWPQVEGLTSRPRVSEQVLPPFTFFDLAPLHLLTTATLACLADLYPQGRFDVRRFRPNLVLEPSGPEHDGGEQRWIGQRLSIGEQVRLQITGACPRCVLTTLPQGNLPTWASSRPPPGTPRPTWASMPACGTAASSARATRSGSKTGGTREGSSPTAGIAAWSKRLEEATRRASSRPGVPGSAPPKHIVSWFVRRHSVAAERNTHHASTIHPTS